MRDTARENEKIGLDKPFDFSDNANWRIFRIMAEFVEGFEFLYPLRREITIFGSSVLTEKSQWYQEAVKLGKLLGENGFTIVTGGGPGIMEAGNRGALEGGGESIGLDIELPQEQRRNVYVKKGIGFHYFFTRKVMLTASAQAYVFFPGGFGTLDEFFEMVTLVQTEKMERVPIVCVGADYWSGVDKWMKTTLLEEYGTIQQRDVELYEIVNSAEEAYELLKDSKERKYF
jgi:uncharacterized protein (TIGR00730 family)